MCLMFIIIHNLQKYARPSYWDGAKTHAIGIPKSWQTEKYVGTES